MRPVPFALVSLLLLVSSVGAQVDRPPRAIPIAFTTFDGPEKATRDRRVDPVVAFVKDAGGEIGSLTGNAVDFEFVLGNYYQVWSWFKQRQIDAAFVSPLIAYLLEREGSATPILELTEKEITDRGSYCPKIAAYGPQADNPEAAFQKHLADVLAAAPATSRTNFVAHLSSSGFVMPTLYALDWLERQNPSEEVREAFWERYLERSRFTLQHGLDATRDPALTEIFFAYSGRGLRCGDTVDGWHDLGAASDWPAPGIPYDVLVVRTSVIRDVLGSEDRSRIAERLMQIAPQTLGPDTVYTGVGRYNVQSQGAFREALERLFGPNATDPTLRRLARQWFDLGRFQFTVDETLGFLRQDQRNAGVSRLALALSGGGVKSLYQAQLLDALYGTGRPTAWLRNEQQRPEDPAPRRAPDQDDPLVVHSIIGTSGGAMLAFFTSLLPGIEGIVAVASPTASKPLFPWVDVPRVVSWIVVLLIFSVLLHAAKALGAIPAPPDGEGPWRVPGGLLRLLLAPSLLVVIAFAIRQLRVPYIEDVRFVRGFEGALYAASAVLIHAALVCVEWRRGPATPARSLRARQGRTGILLGVSIVAVAVTLRVIVAETDTADWVLAWVPLLAMAGTALALASLIVAASGEWLRFHLLYGIEYRRALSLILFVIGVSFFASLWAELRGWSTTLELTDRFWYWTLSLSVLLSLAILVAARHRGGLGSYLRRSVYHLTRDRVGGLTLSLGAGMTAFFLTAILVWVLMVAPAVYGSERAEAALRASLTQDTLESGTFRTNLIVTGAMLSDEPCDAVGGRLAAGPMYSCFEGPSACVRPTDRWQSFGRTVPERALPSVFASGAPFPVFPPKKVSMPNGCAVPLVDGGYAHLVPLEAAVAAEARQVLVIHASPEEPPSESGWRDLASGLLQGAPRVLGFMFTQAQALDQSVGRELMVAALAPRYRKDWPFLLDFRAEKRELVMEEGRMDINNQRRIGRIESWGTPLVYAVVRPERTALSEKWTASIRQALKEPLAGATRRAAAFDLDNTILRGDIGDALFLKIVAELHYRGDDPQFWALIPDATTRDELQKYWRLYSPRWGPGGPEAGRIRYHAPGTWPEGFADYVALFLRQYKQLLAAPDGARVAYPWVVQLMAGLQESKVRELSASLWASEMGRATSAQRVTSSLYDDFTIDGGVRVHADVADLLRALWDRQWDVWIVTASNQYVAEEAARHLGISSSRVRGIRSKTQNGVLTADLEPPITYREGKAQALENAGVRPYLALGDSMTDFEMLTSATIAIVIDRERIPRDAATERWHWQPQSALSTRVMVR